MTDIPQAKIGRRIGDPPEDEVEHFVRCPACGGYWIDFRDLAQVFAHERPFAAPAAGSTAMTGAQARVRVVPLKLRQLARDVASP